MNEHKNVLTDMLLAIDQPVNTLKEEAYPDNFHEFVRKIKPQLVTMDEWYTSVNQQKSKSMIEQFVYDVKQQLTKCKNKRYASLQLSNYNLSMVAYVLPAIKGEHTQESEQLCSGIMMEWKRVFPTSNLSAVDFATIQKGFSRKFCYITTAICETLGKSDDCYELTLFRNYRDTYLESTESGHQMVKQYYDIAPTIVKHINKREDAMDIYQDIYKTYLLPSLACIEAKENAKGQELYIAMVEELKDKYFS